jgi:hypothetical protein
MHLLLLQDAEQLALQRRRHVADFVEEDRAPLSRLEQPRMIGSSVGECAAAMAEELALEQRLGDRRAVHREERPGRAWAAPVERPCQQLLARTALPDEQDRRIARRRAIDELHHRTHGRGHGQDSVLIVFDRTLPKDRDV